MQTYRIARVHPDLIGDIFLPLVREPDTIFDYQAVATMVEASLTRGRMSTLFPNELSKVTVERFDRMVQAGMWRCAAGHQLWCRSETQASLQTNDTFGKSIWRARFYATLALHELHIREGEAARFDKEAADLITSPI